MICAFGSVFTGLSRQIKNENKKRININTYCYDWNTRNRNNY